MFKTKIPRIFFNIFFFATFSVAQSAETIKIAADPWCPFTCDEKSELKGLFIEVAKALLEPEYKIEYTNLAWSRAVNDTREGKFNAIAGALPADAPDFLFPKYPVAKQESCFFGNPGEKWKYKDLKSLGNKTLGLVKDYTYGPPFDDYVKKDGPHLKTLDFITGTDTTERLVKKVLANRIDIMIEDKSVLDFNLSTKPDLKDSKLQKVGCLEGQPIFLAFSPSKNLNSKAVISLFDSRFEKFKKTQKYKEILSRYGIK